MSKETDEDKHKALHHSRVLTTRQTKQFFVKKRTVHTVIYEKNRVRFLLRFRLSSDIHCFSNVSWHRHIITSLTITAIVIMMIMMKMVMMMIKNNLYDVDVIDDELVKQATN